MFVPRKGKGKGKGGQDDSIAQFNRDVLDRAPGDAHAGESPFLALGRNRGSSLQQQRRLLPIARHRDQLLWLLEHNAVVIVAGETGSGKTTQIPQYLHEAGWTAGGRKVVCTQPRRVAATSVATRVAEEVGTRLGEEVGYAIRFNDKWDPERTRIKFTTDGMLLRETMLDPLLSQYSVVMLDEVHERSLHTDVLLGLLKKIRKRRPELKLVLSSATLEADKFAAFFAPPRKKKWDVTAAEVAQHSEGVAVLSVEGRQHQVAVQYAAHPVRDYVQHLVETVMHIHCSEPAGDVLCFLTGQEECESAAQLIQEQAASKPGAAPVLAVPLYAGLKLEDQLSAFEPAERGTRKVVLSTNIAETSVTIEGVVYVVDCGFVKQRLYNPELDSETLSIVPVSRAQAIQRSGRAGRVSAGKAFRLYTEEAFEALPEAMVPELQRVRLDWPVLQLKALGITDILHFNFVSPPLPQAMMRALEVLFALGALTEQGQLTAPVGSTMAELPIEPNISRMLLAACDLGCAEPVLSIAAMLSVSNPYYPKSSASTQSFEWAVKQGDHMSLLNLYNLFQTKQRDRNWVNDNRVNVQALRRASQIRAQLSAYLKRAGLSLAAKDTSPDTICRAIATGYFCNAARLQNDGEYVSIRSGTTMHLHPSSVVFKYPPAWIVYHEVVHTTKPFCRDVCRIDPLWLTEIAPHFYEFRKPKRKAHD